MRKNKNLAFALSLILLASPAFATNSGLQTQSFSTSSSPVLSGQVVSIQSGANATGTVSSGSFSSSSSRVGDRGYLTLTQGLNGIPAGSQVEFEVSHVREAGRGFERPGELQLKAIRLIYPDGRSARLNGEAFITDNSGGVLLKGATRGDRVKSAVKNTGVSTAVGATGGVIAGALSGVRGSRGRSIGRGAIAGAAIGALGGAAYSGFQKGEEVVINQGSKLNLKFTKNTQVVPN